MERERKPMLPLPMIGGDSTLTLTNLNVIVAIFFYYLNALIDVTPNLLVNKVIDHLFSLFSVPIISRIHTFHHL